VQFRRITVNEEMVVLGEPAAPLVQGNVSKSFPVKLLELNLPEVQESKLEQLLTKHAEVFAKSDDDLGYTETVKHTMRTADEIPITKPYRGLPPSQH